MKNTFKSSDQDVSIVKTSESSPHRKNGDVKKSTVSSRNWIDERQQLLSDYKIGWQSRHTSLLGRREVLSGKAKFGIFGDGKEVPQLAMARVFQYGDFRSGYYRDQTFMFAKEILTISEFFAQLYAIPDVQLEPSSAGRSMNGHFGTRTLNEDGTWKNLTELYNSSSDISPTGSQMPRLVGLAYASKLYKEVDALKSIHGFSTNGQEIAFGTIGNASCAEGMFWESVNAIGVLRVPALISIWDDGYGISVPNDFQNTKGNLGEILSGFQRKPGDAQGYDIYVVKGWDYPRLVEVYELATQRIRQEGFPAIIHVVEVTQPQGHSTSGSHERYKSDERLAWETQNDCLVKMREWLVSEKIATEEELTTIENDAALVAKQAKESAWGLYINPIKAEIQQLVVLIQKLQTETVQSTDALASAIQELQSIREPYRADYFIIIHKVLRILRLENLSSKKDLIAFRDMIQAQQVQRYSSYLHSQSNENARRIPTVQPTYSENTPSKNGSEILNATFDYWLENDPRIIAFGEDVGQLGDVNQGLVGMQTKYGALRVSDTGIREVTILGQAIGMALRGLRPICEMQYLDYILYSLQLMSDDLSTIQWRTKGGQKAPVIIRTRGHRLEGVWHSGSPMAGIINLVRGMYVCVPRDMTQAAGMYNTLLQSDEPAIVVEVLNGYRLKEKLPENIGRHTIELGVPEVLIEGSDITIVTYGATCRVALKAAEMLLQCGISAEVIDVQTLLPFDTKGIITQSLAKTNRVVFVDEDVPGGTTAYMMQNVLEQHNGYQYLDSKPSSLSAQAHRPAYGTDGNYWSKPEAEHIFDAVYNILHESNPQQFPNFTK